MRGIAQEHPGRITRPEVPGMELIPAKPFNLHGTLNSGQVFHWNRQGQGWNGLIGDTEVTVAEGPDGLLASPNQRDLVTHYFALDHDLAAIYASFPEDETAQAALDTCRGLRIIRQPKWECLATFITSSMKQVAHIRQMSLALRARFGKPVENQHAFPTPAELASATEADLRACGLGYRAKNLLATARNIAEGTSDLEALADLPTEDLRSRLCTFPGVGVKVANCVLLFAYERLDAVPIDVWIGRILRETYLKRRRKITPRLMEQFAARYFGPNAGYVQQYLFHQARTRK